MPTILVAAAHSDDEALGAGGAIARHTSAGDEVVVVFASDGVSSRLDVDARADTARRLAAERATGILGVSRIVHLGYADNQLDTVPLLQLTQSLENVVANFAPTMVYTHSRSDLNVDHRRVHEAVLTACRPQPGCTVKEIYSFEIVSSTDWSSAGFGSFTPTLYVDIRDQIELKMTALREYDVEMRAAPHSRSYENVKALARLRGMTVGSDYAEAFEVVRIVR